MAKKIDDPTRRQKIVEQCQPAPRNPTGRRLELRVTAHSKGWFIGTKGAKDVSCSSKDVALREMAHLLDILEQTQQAAR